MLVVVAYIAVAILVAVAVGAFMYATFRDLDMHPAPAAFYGVLVGGGVGVVWWVAVPAIVILALFYWFISWEKPAARH